MTTLWDEAGYDHDELARTAALARVDAELQDVMPFLLAARSPQEYSHRRALAEQRLETIALRHGLQPDEVAAITDHRFELYHEAMMQRMALPEGQDPLAWVPDGGGFGSGPEQGYEHDETVDYSHGYSEVPQGAPGGPSPAVTRPVQTQPGPVQEATGRRVQADVPRSGGGCIGCGHTPHLGQPCNTEGCRHLHNKGEEGAGPGMHARTIGHVPDPANPGYSKAREAAKRCSCGRKLKDSGCAGCGMGPGECDCKPKKSSSLQRTAQDSNMDYLSTTPPDMGVGQGSVDTSVNPMGPSLSAGVSPGDLQPQPGIGQVTSSQDPVHRQIQAVASSIAAANPGLPQGECRRVARQVVGRYLIAGMTPDQLTNSQVSGNPGPDMSAGSSGGSGGDDHSPGLLQHYLMGKGITSLLPGGEGAAAGEGAAGGAAADLAELAPLALA